MTKTETGIVEQLTIETDVDSVELTLPELDLVAGGAVVVGLA